MTLLAIGIKTSLCDELYRSASEPILTIDDRAQAIAYLEAQEVSGIVIENDPGDDDTIHSILSVTSITTPLLLVCRTADQERSQRLAKLGVVTLPTPTHATDIWPLIYPTKPSE